MHGGFSQPEPLMSAWDASRGQNVLEKGQDFKTMTSQKVKNFCVQKRWLNCLCMGDSHKSFYPFEPISQIREFRFWEKSESVKKRSKIQKFDLSEGYFFVYKNLGVTADAKESLKPILPIENKTWDLGGQFSTSFKKDQKIWLFRGS